MRFGFYPKLALTGIVKNKKIYFPYILTSTAMVMMLYIVTFLANNDTVAQMKGGASVQSFLGLGCGVIGIFSAILLFYTNSFLIRRRKKEFGLYNILGMGKMNLARILTWETVMISLFSMIIGLGCGILFSKAAELVVANMLDSSIVFAFEIKSKVIIYTLAWFGAIFILILLNALRQIHLSNPIELLHSENVGEKPPKANWLLALIGLLLLGGAYYLAVRIEEPISAMMWFFVAVIMVILATYLLFIAGSVVFCRLLQKNKKYYYKTNHFISVSSMVYRMKRNGAGLASICILSTMVLVMISSTACLYIGREDVIRRNYPRDISIEVYTTDGVISEEEKAGERVRQISDGITDAFGVTRENLLCYRYLSAGAYVQGDQVIFDMDKVENDFVNYADITQLFVIPLDDYNQAMGTSETLMPGEALLYRTMGSYNYDRMSIEGAADYQIRKTDKEFVSNSLSDLSVFSSIYLVVSDMQEVERISQAQQSVYGGNASGVSTYYGFDLSCGDDMEIVIRKQISNEISANEIGASVNSMAENRDNFYALYGGFFILGIILGVVFISGAVLIMYYKQIIEGYEDQSRFEILQKVGMTKKEIRKSVNSQILTIFFMPLLMAGLHTAFAFPMVQKLLLLFAVTNTKLLFIVTGGSFLLFAVFYILVYLATSKAYYGIVSGKKPE